VTFVWELVNLLPLCHHQPTMNLQALFTKRASIGLLALSVVFSIVSSLGLPLRYDDDVIRFLPDNDPEVERLHDISNRFGSIHVALVGVETDNLFQPEVLRYIRRVAAALKANPDAVKHVTAITELPMIQTHIDTDYEVVTSIDEIPQPIPTDELSVRALRDLVMAQDHLVGSVIASDGSSTRIVVQLQESLDGQSLSPNVLAAAVRTSVDSVTEKPDNVTLHFGGAPFIAEAAASGSQEDLLRLSPYVCGIILLLVLITIGSFRLAMLALTTVGLGILWTLGVIGWLGYPRTLVSSSLPVVLVALGSAYAVHLLVWYRTHDGTVSGMLQKVGWPVIVAGLTTVAGFLSFLIMDIAPMREFGGQLALGTALCTLASLTVIPSVLTLFPVPSRKSGGLGERLDRWLVAFSNRVQAHRWLVLLVGLGLVTFFAFQLPKIETRMDTKSFFKEGSAPDRADKFFTDKFGGAIYLQVLVSADMTDPRVMRRLSTLDDHLRTVPGVTQVESIAHVLGIYAETETGVRQIPSTEEAINSCLGIVKKNDDAVSLLMDDEKKSALLQVAIGAYDTEQVRVVTERIRSLLTTHMPAALVTVERLGDILTEDRNDAATRIVRLTGGDPNLVSQVARRLTCQITDSERAALRTAVQNVLKKQLAPEGDDDEPMVYVDGERLPGFMEQVAEQMANCSLRSKASFRTELAKIADAEELIQRDGKNPVPEMNKYARKAADSIFARLVPVRLMHVTRPIAKRIGEPLGTVNRPTERRIEAIVDDLLWVSTGVRKAASDTPDVAAVQTVVSGHPVVQEAMSRSVHRNQEYSFAIGLPLVLLILCVVFRSAILGFVAFVPTGLTLMIIFGLMGLMPRDLPMDMASSMLSSIALGVGIDYAIHFLWRARESDIASAMQSTGRAILINALEITAGFGVLSFATIVPVSRFGILIAITLLVAAVASLVFLPALLSWTRKFTTP